MNAAHYGRLSAFFETLTLDGVEDAFKEQLKADEASKAKAERLARKLAEEERNKPVSLSYRPARGMHPVIPNN
jgi:hypothetical protein